MLLNELPATINPEQLCRKAPIEGMCLFGKIKLSELGNLSEELKAQTSKEVTVSLIFSVDEEGICCIKGELGVDLSQICQRCLQPMTQVINANFKVSPVASDEQAKELPSRYEPLLVLDGEIAFAEWIAEELLLALPLVPRHDPICVSYGDYSKESEEEPEKKVFPFAGLKNLK